LVELARHPTERRCSTRAGARRLRCTTCPLTYERRDPSAGPLHQLLSDKLESYLEARAERPLPGFVVDTLRGFLRCGILRHGFARFRCDDCAQSRLVALSCKQRAFCPRCVGRKMADQAKHLVENVLPPVPYRQWVLSFPHALRWRMAHNHELTLGVWGIARAAIDALYRARAASLGPPGQHSSARPGSVMAIQRFGGALNLNVHFHALYTDGSFYERSDGQLVFLHAAPPTVAELATLVADIKRRVVQLLEKLGLGPDEDDDWDAQQLLLGMGELYGEGVFHKGAQRLRNGKPRAPSTFARLKAHEDGFDLDAQVTVSAGARASLEQLVRYILRPPLKETRLTTPCHQRGIDTEDTVERRHHPDTPDARPLHRPPGRPGPPAARQHPAVRRPLRRQRPPPPPGGGLPAPGRDPAQARPPGQAQQAPQHRLGRAHAAQLRPGRPGLPPLRRPHAPRGHRPRPLEHPTHPAPPRPRHPRAPRPLVPARADLRYEPDEHALADAVPQTTSPSSTPATPGDPRATHRRPAMHRSVRAARCGQFADSAGAQSPGRATLTRPAGASCALTDSVLRG
jgi:hypothetical protein